MEGKFENLKFKNILATIGRTPIVRLNKLAPPHVNVFVKIEAFNPMGSVNAFRGQSYLKQQCPRTRFR